MTNDQPLGQDSLNSDGKIALLEETASVSTRDSITGRVRVTTNVETVREIARAALESEDVEITRLSINQPVVGSPPTIRMEGDLTIIPILEEVMIVETKLILKEELHIRKRVKTEFVEAPVMLRKQSATIDRFEVRDSKPVD